MGEVSKIRQAMAAFQANPPKLKHDRQGQYGYLSLPGLLAAVRPKLAELGLFLQWNTAMVSRGTKDDSDFLEISCTVSHVEGGSLTAAAYMPVMKTGGRGNPMHLMGGAITFGRRYSCLMVLGLPDVVDDNAEVATPMGPVTAEEAQGFQVQAQMGADARYAPGPNDTAEHPGVPF